MNTPGSILKTEREKQNRSLKDISTDLKIKTEYLKALEEDNYEVLPAEIYTKSYLRLYADTLHINNDHLLDLYKNLTKPGEPEGDDAAAKKKSNLDFDPSSLIIPDTEHKSYRRYFNIKNGLIVASVLLIAIIAIITTRDEEKAVVMTGTDDQKIAVTDQKAAVTAGSDKQKTAPAVVSDQKKVSASADSNKQKITVTDQKAAVTAGSDKQKTAPAVVSDQKKASVSVDGDKQKAAATADNDNKKTAATAVNKVTDTPAAASKTTGKLSLQVLATETTWVSVRIDNAPRREWSIRKDETLTLEANEKFVIKVGNAGGTKLLLNGKDLGVLGPPGKVTDIVIP